MRPLLVVFAGGASGPWGIQRIDAVIGESIPITEGPLAPPAKTTRSGLIASP